MGEKSMDVGGDVELVRRMADSCSESAATFYRRYRPVALAVIVPRIASRAVAEEIVQDVFVELWQRAASYSSDRGTVATWVRLVARSRAIDSIRRRRRAAKLEDPRSHLSPAAPDEGLACQWMRGHLEAALTELTPSQSQLIELKYARGLSHEEIARRLDTPVGTVKSRIHAAKRRLRTAMAA